MPKREINRMKIRIISAAVFLVLLTPVCFAQEGTYLIHYAGNFSLGDSILNLTNTGSSIGLEVNTTPVPGGPVTSRRTPVDHPSSPAPQSSNGDICANVYVFSPDEQLQECCSCFLTPNALHSFSVRNDLITNPLTGVVPTSVVIKLVATVAGLGPTAKVPASSPLCNPATAGQKDISGNPIGQPLATGLAAWGTNTHLCNMGTAVTETPFTVGQLSDGELARITGLCAFIQSNGSGAGLCKSCALGGQ